MYTYTFFQWLMFFFIYCFLGWCFESTYVSIKQRHFVNRGFLTLPMLPIYGSGALAILIVTIPVKDYYVLVYMFGMMSSTLLELVTGAVMEAVFKVKYWDYTNQRFNYKGYICLSSSIAWGFFAILLTEVLHKPIETWVLKMNPVLMYVILAIVSVLFVADTIVSFKAAWDLRRILERLQQLRLVAEEKRLEFESRMEDTRERVESRIEDTKERLEARVEDRKEKLEAHVEDRKEKLEAHVENRRERLGAYSAEFREQMERFIKKDPFRFFIGMKLRGNPGATSKLFNEALSELREHMGRRHKDERD